MMPNLNAGEDRVGVWADKGYVNQSHRSICTEISPVGEPVRDAEIEVENAIMRNIRSDIECAFGDMKNVFKYFNHVGTMRIQQGDANSRRNQPVLFARKEIVVGFFLLNLRTLTRQNRTSTAFGFVRAGVPAVEGAIVLPTLEAYCDSFDRM